MSASQKCASEKEPNPSGSKKGSHQQEKSEKNTNRESLQKCDLCRTAPLRSEHYNQHMNGKKHKKAVVIAQINREKIGDGVDHEKFKRLYRQLYPFKRSKKKNSVDVTRKQGQTEHHHEDVSQAPEGCIGKQQHPTEEYIVKTKPQRPYVSQAHEGLTGQLENLSQNVNHTGQFGRQYQNITRTPGQRTGQIKQQYQNGSQIPEGHKGQFEHQKLSQFPEGPVGHFRHPHEDVTQTQGGYTANRYNYRPWHSNSNVYNLHDGNMPHLFNNKGILGPPPMHDLPLGRGKWFRDVPRYGRPGLNTSWVSKDYNEKKSFQCGFLHSGKFMQREDCSSGAKEGDQDKNDLSIEDFRSSIAKKADLSTPSSTDNVDAKNKFTQKFSAKTSQIIDDVLMGRPRKPKVVSKQDQWSPETPSNKEVSETASEKRSELLTKAQKVCEESRIRRHLAKKAINSCDEVGSSLKDFNKEVAQLTKRALRKGDPAIKSNIQKDFQEENLRDIHGISEQLSFDAASSVPIDSYSTAREEVSASLPSTSMRTSCFKPSSPKVKGKLGKDSLKKLITAPRSRKDQMMVAKMMQNYSKTKPSLRSRLTIGTDAQPDPDSPIDMEDLPNDVQMQIAQLLEEEAETDGIKVDPRAMNVTELKVEPGYSSDANSEDDLEMVMILEDDMCGNSYFRAKSEQDEPSNLPGVNAVTARPTDTPEDFSSGSSYVDQNMTKRRRLCTTTTAEEAPRSPDSVQTEGGDSISKRPRIDSLQDLQKNEIEIVRWPQPGQAGTVEKLLEISLQEENVRSQLLTAEQEIQQLQIMIMRTQQQLQSKMAYREQLTKEEARLRGQRLEILKDAASEKSSEMGSLQSSQISKTTVKCAPPTSEGNEVVIREPDTTTVLDISPGFVTPESGPENLHQQKGNKRNERTLSQSSTEQSGDSEYTAQYLGTLKVDTQQEGLKKLAANLADLQKASFVILREGDIKDFDSDGKETATVSPGEVKVGASGSCDSNRDHRLNQECTVLLDKLKSDVENNFGKNTSTVLEGEEISHPTVKCEPMEIISMPASPVARKKRKTKKERNSSRSKGKIKSSPAFSDGSSAEEELQVDRTTRKNKIPASPDSKLLREYLHASSSSDVDLESNRDNTDIPKTIFDDDKLKIKRNRIEALRQSALRINIRAKEITPVEQDVFEPRVKTFKGHTGTVHCMKVFGGYLFTGSEDSTARKFNLESCKCDAVYEGHSKGVQCVYIFKHPRSAPKIITGSFDKSIISSDIETGTQERQLFFSSRVMCCCEHNGKLYLGLADGTIPVVDIKAMIEVDVLHGSDQGVRCIKTAKEGARHLLLTASVDGAVSIRDIRSGLFFRSITGHTKSPLDMMVENNLLFSVGVDKTAQIHDISTGDFKESLVHKGVVTSVCVDKNYLYTAGYECVVSCYNRKTYKQDKIFYGAGKDVVTSMLVHDSKLYTGTKDGCIESINLPDQDVKWPCKFGRCHKRYGLKDHLEHHVVKDHIMSSNSVARCLWDGCNCYLNAHEHLKEAVQHILGHLND